MGEIRWFLYPQMVRRTSAILLQDGLVSKLFLNPGHVSQDVVGHVFRLSIHPFSKPQWAYTPLCETLPRY